MGGRRLGLRLSPKADVPQLKLKTKTKMKTRTKHNFCVGMACLALAIAPAHTIAGTHFDVKHLANQQNLVCVAEATRYLLLPVQDNAPEAKVGIIVGNELCGQMANVRLARERVDYYVPLDLTAHEGKDVKVDVQGIDADAACWKKLRLADTFDTANREKFRPLYHHTPAYGWMNDPNGMFYKDGTWHLFFQHNPYGSTWGNLSWGHSTSTDLVQWEPCGDPITPDAFGLVFSGSAVIDSANTAGFGPGAVVAFYTSAKPTPWGDNQMQCMAYSTDGGKTFTKYGSNPVLTSAERDFRDPKVFWHAPTHRWVMLLAVGQEMQIFSSANLMDWKYESSFGSKQGAHGGVWECPDLVELPVEGTKERRWVLICNINPGGPFGGSATQYFVGRFDGRKFTNDYPTKTKWMDYGKDHYATVTFSGAPGGRCVAMGWMSNWQYAASVPTLQYRSANTIARELSLYRQGGDLLLKCAPVAEMEAARADTVAVKPFSVSDAHEVSLLPGDGAYEIDLAIRNKGAQKIVLTLANAKGESVAMYYDMAAGEFVMDRSNSGQTGFSADFPAMTVAPTANAGEIELRLFVDRSSIEAFGDGGKFAMTNLVFPSEPYGSLKFESVRGGFVVKRLNVYKIK